MTVRGTQKEIGSRNKQMVKGTYSFDVDFAEKVDRIDSYCSDILNIHSVSY